MNRVQICKIRCTEVHVATAAVTTHAVRYCNVFPSIRAHVADMCVANARKLM